MDSSIQKCDSVPYKVQEMVLSFSASGIKMLEVTCI